ncbi:MAG: 5'-nucleotidase C-terminal domain-containing protein [Bryobacteraceae bacterium]
MRMRFLSSPRLAAGFLSLIVASAGTVWAETAKIRILVTTDLHGNIYPYDYFTSQPANRGLAKIATLIADARATSQNTLLIDCGDTIQGTPLEYVHQQSVASGAIKKQAAVSDPMMAVMNLLRYDAMVLGNHEFNFGLVNLDKARNEAKFPWLSANTKPSSDSVRPFEPYLIKELAGVRIAIIGLTTPGIPQWEKPENFAGYSFAPGVEAAKRVVALVKEKEHPDLIVIAAHSGLDRNPKTGARFNQDLPGENFVYQLGQEVEGVDVILFGHTHSEMSGIRLADALLVQPKNWGASLGQVDLRLERSTKSDGVPGPWQVAAKTSKLIPVTAQTQADDAVLKLAAPYHEAALRYLNTPVTSASASISAAAARVEDTAILDAVHTVQLHEAKADVSFASSFNPRATITKGKVTVREIAALYLYDNTLYAIEGNGKMVREALENAARFYTGCEDAACSSGAGINKQFIGFNYDTAAGVSYEIDLTQPVGQRIRNLTFRGKALADDQPLRIAVNNYRYGGSGGYTMFPGAKVLWRSTAEIRDLIIRYYSGKDNAKAILPEKADGNWRIVPEAARRRLIQESSAPVPNSQ